jgi:hypothetical protein
MKINIFEYIVMRKMIFSSEKPPKINKIKKHDVPDLYRSLHRICFYLEFCLQFRIWTEWRIKWQHDWETA